jgi:hypothetical protein
MPARRTEGKTAVKKTVKKSAPTMAAKRKDLGAPVGGYFADQPPEKRVLLEKLRALVKKGYPAPTPASSGAFPSIS